MERISIKELPFLLRKPNKYRKSSTDPGDKELRTYKGILYSSKMEMRRAVELDRMMRNGLIHCWYRQIKVYLPDKSYAYTPDFMVIEACKNRLEIHFEDVKVFITQRMSDSIHMWKRWEKLPLRLIRLQNERWEIMEEIIPEKY